MKRTKDRPVNVPLLIGVTLLLVATLALSFLALRSPGGKVENAGETPGYVPVSHEVLPQPEEVEDKEETPVEEVEVVEPTPVSTQRVLGVQDGDVAYRALGGACAETDFTVEVTRDGGATWAATTDTAGLGLGGVERLLVRDDGSVSALASTQADCLNLLLAQSYDAGANWSLVDGGTAMTWHILPSNPASAYSPRVGAVTLPCEAKELAAVDVNNAAALCTDGRLATTADAGASWSASDPFVGATSLGTASGAYLLTQAGEPGCAGTLVSRVNGAFAVETSSCLTDVPGADTAIAGATNGVAWLWAGDAVRRSFDGGYNWQ